MGDRIIIVVKGADAQLYVHWEPENLYETLYTFNKKFDGMRGFDDPSYKLARLTQYLTNNTDSADGYATTGFGIVTEEEDSAKYTLTFGDVLTTVLEEED